MHNVWDWRTISCMSTTAVPTWELHHRLARALEWGEVTAEEMAEVLGVHVNSIYNYAAGRRVPKRGFVAMWAMRCGVPLDWLLNGEGGSGGPDHDQVMRRVTTRETDGNSDSVVRLLVAA